MNNEHVQTYTIAHLFIEYQVSCILKYDLDIHCTKDMLNILQICLTILAIINAF